MKPMSPQEKADQLINNFYLENIRWGLITAKNHALICVDEIILQWEYIDTYLADGNGELNPNLKYWYEVRKGIENYKKI